MVASRTIREAEHEFGRRGGLLFTVTIALLVLLLAICAGDALAQQSGSERAGASSLRSINVGFVRQAFGIWSAKIADGSFDTATGRTIRWFPHDTDSSLIVALSSGRLDIGMVGSSVAASAIARGLDLRIFYVLATAPETEGLVVGPGITLKPGEAKGLHGKVLAVPFGSTAHFQLLATLRRWGASLSSLRIVNLQSSQIGEAWMRNEIDAAAASEPLLSQLLQRGHRVPLAASTEHGGVMVFAAPGDFVAQHVVFLSRFIDVIARADQTLTEVRQQLTQDSAELKPIAFLTGMSPEAVLAALGRYRPITLADQVSPTWLGGGTGAGLLAHLKSVAEVWRWAGRMPGGEPDLGGAIAIEPAQMALGYQR